MRVYCQSINIICILLRIIIFIHIIYIKLLFRKNITTRQYCVIKYYNESKNLNRELRETRFQDEENKESIYSEISRIR